MLTNLDRFLITLRPILVDMNSPSLVDKHWPRIEQTVRELGFLGHPLRGGMKEACAALHIPPTPEALAAYLTMSGTAS